MGSEDKTAAGFLAGIFPRINLGASIKQKLIALGVVIMAIQLAQLAVSVWVDAKAMESSKKVLAYQKKLSAIQMMRINALQLSLEVAGFITEREMGTLNTSRLADISGKLASLRTGQERMAATAEGDEGSMLAQSIGAAVEELSAALREDLPRLIEKKAPGWEFIGLGETVAKKGNDVNQWLTKLEISVAGGVSEAVTRGGEASALANKIGVAVFLVSALLMAAAIAWIARSLLRGIRGLTAMARDMAEGEGDLTRRIGVTSTDEIGELAGWFNRFVDNLREQLTKVAANTQTLSTSAKELLTISNGMVGGTSKISERAVSVAGATEQLSANIGAMASSVEQISQTVAGISTGAGKMSQDMSAVSAIVKRMTESIGQIDKSAKETTKTAGRAMEMSRSASQTMGSPAPRPTRSARSPS
jgi:methyl-accepting chemotaxis protein